MLYKYEKIDIFKWDNITITNNSPIFINSTLFNFELYSYNESDGSET